MTKFLQRLTAFLLVAAMAVPLLAGCSSEQAPDETSASTTGTTTANPQEPTPPTDDESIPQAGELVITEVMTSNTATVKDAFGEYTDWFELYNASDRTLSLKNCFLSDSEGKPYQYQCPDVTVAAGEYILFFASDRNTITNGTQYHTNFKLSAGEGVYLTHMGTSISSLTSPRDLADDVSFGLMWDGQSNLSVYFATPTPGAANGGSWAQVQAELSLATMGIRINEFMMKNEAVLYDEDGDCPDWVELYNASDKAISLKGFGLSDSFDDPLKWTFPDITLEAGEYLLVLLSGKDKFYTASSLYLHADFKLSGDDDGLLLSSDKGITIDRIATVALPESASYGRDPSEAGSWKFFTRPTPGKQNPANGLDTLEAFTVAALQKVYVNEVCSVSSDSQNSVPDEDWIELYNNTDEAVNLAGWSLSKSVGDLRYYTFPDVTIAPHGYLVVNASGTASDKVKSLDAGFKISHTGSTVYLVDAEGMVTDAFETGLQRAGISSGRTVENGVLTRVFYSSPSKGKANTAEGSAPSYAQPAVLESSAGVLIADRHTVTITTAERGGVIRYTLDGTKPTADSPIYEAPLELTESAVIRAIVSVNGKIDSECVSRTFLVEDEHDLNVVCLTCDPDDLFSDERGIWADGPGWTAPHPHKGANYWKNWEREVFFEYYEKDGTLGIGFSAGIKNHGQYSRVMKQKSVSINLKEVFGSGTTYYPFFGEDGVSVFDNLLLRTGGQDGVYTNIIDAYCARVVTGQMDLDLMNDHPVAVYVNGEYWGMYYIRDKINESYVYYRQGIEEDNLDMIKGNKTVQTGSFDAHNALLTYIRTHDLSVQEHFDYVASQIDIEEWTNYWIVETFFSNTDTGNIRFYCPKDGTGKWRWILFDLDWACFRSTYHWNMIEEFIAPSGHGNGNNFSTTIAVGLFKNAEYKKYFIETYAKYMHTVFAPDRLLAILDDMVAEVDSEMVRHCERWSSISYAAWQRNITRLRNILLKRWEYSKGDLQETFKLSDAYMAELFPETTSE
ncbi:MAG: lamin tail domain-containing protein [Clostridia bacterium]|nr:lamin tail domain-containing protein [Clostridia bacterium]